MAHIALLSPAKSLRFDDAPLGAEESLPWTAPRFAEKTAALSQALSLLSAQELMSLMELSRPLAELNRSRFERLCQPPSSEPREPEARRAIFAFNGDAYEGLCPETLETGELASLNDSLRVLSGLYGLLRPSDAILPYRLEMGRRPPGIGAKSLPAFWGESIALLLAQDAKALGAEWIVNLASEEYAKAALPHLPDAAPHLRLIHTRFESQKASGWKVVSFDAKRARGLFARLLASRPHDAPSQTAREFNAEGWRFESARGEEGPGPIELLFRKPA